MVIEGTTLPSYEDGTFSSDVEVEDESEEVFEHLIPPENSSFSDPSPVVDNNQETDSNKNANHSETSEGFPSDKGASVVSDNLNLNESSNSVSFVENSGIENVTTQKTSGTEEIHDFANNTVETAHVGRISVNSNDQNFTETDTNQVLANDNYVESTVNNITDNFNNKTEENDDIKKLDDIKDEKIAPESESTNTKNADTFDEPHPTSDPPQLNEHYSINDGQLADNSTTLEPIPNSNSYVTPPPTEIPKAELSDEIKHVKEELVVPQLEFSVGVEKHSVSEDPNLRTVSEADTSVKEDETSLQKGLGIETTYPPPKPDLTSEEEQTKESLTVPSAEKDNSHVYLFQQPGGSFLSQVPPQTEFASIQDPSSDLNVENVKPASAEPLPGLMPGPDIPKYDSPDISNTYNYASDNILDYIHNDSSESLPNENLSNPVQEKLVEDTTVSHPETSIVDHVSNQPYPEQVVTEPLPIDNSVKEGNVQEDNYGFNAQTDELADTIQEGDGWFSSISSIMGSFTEMFTKSDIEVDREDVTTFDDPLTPSEKSSSQQSIGNYFLIF